MSNYFKITIRVVSLGILALLTSLSWADLTAKVDRSVLDSNETLRLEIRYDGQVFTGEPDFKPLSNDFDVLSNNRQQSYSNVNGKTESFTAWTIQLRPKRAGILLIPSISFKGDISNALELRVRAAPANPTAANPGTQPIYTETLVDNDTVYVNQQIILTHRLYTSINLRDYSLSELKIANALLHRLGDTTYQKVLNGRTYLVLEVKYAVFPQSAGQLEIPSLRFGAYEVNTRSQFGVFNNRGNQVIRDTESVQVNIEAPPSQTAGLGWMPSSKVSLEQRWSGDLENATVGEPITRTVTITAKGLSSAQITPLEVLQSSDYRVYPDQPQLDQSLSSEGLTSTRIESFALVPNQSGEITLPPIEVRWWDINEQREQISRLPSTTLQVLPSVSNADDDLANDGAIIGATALSGNNLSAESPTISKPPNSNLISISLALNAILASLIVAMLIVRKTQARRENQDSSMESQGTALQTLRQQLKTIEDAAKSDDLMAMRDAILMWGKTLFAERPPKTLKALAVSLEDKDIEQQFEQLDRQLFQDKNTDLPELDIKLLLSQIKYQSTFSRGSSSRDKAGQALKDLYPT